MKKLSKKQREKLEQKKDFKINTRATFIIGVSFFSVGLYRFLFTAPSVTMSQKTKHPIMFDGSYLIFIGGIMLILWVYRIFFLKKP